MDTLNTQVENALKNRDYQLVMHKASSSFARQLDVDTLQSCQMVALWKAIKNFDPTRGTQIFTYLYKCVYVECLKEVKFQNKGKRADSKLHDNIEAKPTSTVDVFDLMDEVDNEADREMLQDRLQNKTIAEMAETRGVSREIVRRRLKRLTGRIRRRHLAR